MNILLYLNFVVFFINIIQPKYIPYQLSFNENIIIYMVLSWFAFLIYNEISHLRTMINQNHKEIKKMNLFLQKKDIDNIPMKGEPGKINPEIQSLFEENFIDLEDLIEVTYKFKVDMRNLILLYIKVLSCRLSRNPKSLIIYMDYLNAIEMGIEKHKALEIYSKYLEKQGRITASEKEIAEEIGVSDKVLNNLEVI